MISVALERPCGFLNRHEQFPPQITDREQDGIPGHELNLWIWYRVPGIPDFTPLFDLIREERILSAILGSRLSLTSLRAAIYTSLRWLEG